MPNVDPHIFVASAQPATDFLGTNIMPAAEKMGAAGVDAFVYEPQEWSR